LHGDLTNVKTQKNSRCSLCRVDT